MTPLEFESLSGSQGKKWGKPIGQGLIEQAISQPGSKEFTPVPPVPPASQSTGVVNQTCTPSPQSNPVFVHDSSTDVTTCSQRKGDSHQNRSSLH